VDGEIEKLMRELLVGDADVAGRLFRPDGTQGLGRAC
jgi:hypothetical protein